MLRSARVLGMYSGFGLLTASSRLEITQEHHHHVFFLKNLLLILSSFGHLHKTWRGELSSFQ